MSKINQTTVVCLIASRTDTKVWQETIFRFARAICFMKGRQHFKRYDENCTVGPATFGSAIVVFTPRLLTNSQWQVLQTFGKTIEL